MMKAKIKALFWKLLDPILDRLADKIASRQMGCPIPSVWSDNDNGLKVTAIDEGQAVWTSDEQNPGLINDNLPSEYAEILRAARMI